MENVCIQDAIEDLNEIPRILYRLVEMVDEIDKVEYKELKHQTACDAIYLLQAIASNIEVVFKVLEPYYWVEKPAPQDGECAPQIEE